MKKSNYGQGHATKGGVGCYTDSNPGLTPYRGVDQNGNPIGAFERKRPELTPPETNSGFAAKLPKK